MKKRNFQLSSLVLVLAFTLIPFLITKAEKSPIYFFYGDGCSYCEKVVPLVDQMQSKYPEAQIQKLEVWRDLDNGMILQNMYDSYNVPYPRGVPILFVNGKYYSGYLEIQKNLENEIILYVDSLPEANSDENVIAELSRENTVHSTESHPISFWAVTGAAVVDSINPCAIAVLVILISALMLTQDKKRALMGGIAFTVSIYISYLLFGFGIIFTLQASGLSVWFYKIIGIIAILIGLFNLKDFFWYGGGGFVMEIPRAWRPRMKKLLRSVTSPIGAFFIGFVVILFELPCTGGPYFFVLGLLSYNETWTTIVPLLLYYNLIFVLPLLIITTLIYFGLSKIENVGNWKDRNIRLFHLIGGIIMVLLGVWVMLF
jgi:cytochrome c biogenesis protein CcdA